MQLVTYYSRILWSYNFPLGENTCYFFAGRADIRPIHSQKTHVFKHAYPTNIRLLSFFTFHSALAVFQHAATAVLSFIRLLPFFRMPPLPFFLSFGSCRFPACRRCRFIFDSALAVLPFREISEGFFVALETFARYGFFGDIG